MAKVTDKITVTEEYENSAYYWEALEYQREIERDAMLYREVYNWARSLWKHSDKESITIEELQDFFYSLSDKENML